MATAFLSTHDSRRIAYDLFENHHPHLVILVPGFFNSRKAVLFRQMATELLKDFDVAVMDLRGHGDSSGLFTWTAEESDDLLALVEFLKSRYRKVSVIGFSLGAASSLIAASKTEKIHRLIAVSAPTDFWKIEIHFWDMDPEENIAYNLWKEGRIGKGVRPGWLWHPKIKPIDVVGKIKCPTMFIHGDKDWLIRPWHSQALFEKARCEKRLEIVKNGTHAEYIYRSHEPDMFRLFREWLSTTD